MLYYLLGFIAVGHGWIACAKYNDGEPWSAGAGFLMGLFIMWISIYKAKE